MDNLLKMRDRLGVRPDDLLEEAGLIPAVEEDEAFWELWAVIRRLGPAERREVLHYARFREMKGR